MCIRYGGDGGDGGPSKVTIEWRFDFWCSLTGPVVVDVGTTSGEVIFIVVVLVAGT